MVFDDCPVLGFLAAAAASLEEAGRGRALREGGAETATCARLLPQRDFGAKLSPGTHLFTSSVKVKKG